MHPIYSPGRIHAITFSLQHTPVQGKVVLILFVCFIHFLEEEKKACDAQAIKNIAKEMQNTSKDYTLKKMIVEKDGYFHKPSSMIRQVVPFFRLVAYQTHFTGLLAADGHFVFPAT